MFFVWLESTKHCHSHASWLCLTFESKSGPLPRDGPTAARLIEEHATFSGLDTSLFFGGLNITIWATCRRGHMGVSAFGANMTYIYIWEFLQMVDLLVAIQRETKRQGCQHVEDPAGPTSELARAPRQCLPWATWRRMWRGA